MDNISNRIETLSPEKRKLLEILMKKERERDLNHKQVESQSAPPDNVELIVPVKEEDLTNKQEVKRFYNSVNSQLNSSPFGEHSIFLNYGYLPNDTPHYSQIELPPVYMNKNPTRLVLEVIGDCQIERDFNILDVGCGRGGTVTVFRKFFTFRKMVGIDLSSKAISFCRKSHKYGDTEFIEGDAENLPFNKEIFHAVTNIESSHGYRNIESFWREVHRVLKGDGYFLYTDLFPGEELEEKLSSLCSTGFELLRRVDITGNVLLSCDEIAGAHARAYSGNNDAEFMGNFLAMPDSPVYNDMKKGKSAYMILKLRKR